MISSISSNQAFAANLASTKRSEAKSEPKAAEPRSELSPKAAAIAEKLAAGEYKIDLKATAKAMLSELA